jgi:o-succinylbenzoate---CoA ligase
MQLPESERLYPCPLAAGLSRHPDRCAVDAGAVRISYAELDRAVSGVADVVADTAGQGPIALWLENDWQTVAIILGVIRAGRVVAPLNVRYPAERARELLGPLDAALTIAPDEVPVPGPRLPAGALLASKPTRGPTPPWDLASVATVVHTSGSTGAPRAAYHTLGNHVFSALGSNENIPLGEGDRWLLSLPLYHVGGLAVVFRCLIAGATIVLPDRDEALERSIRRATHVSLVGTQLFRWMTAWEGLPDQLRAVLLGGGEVARRIVEQALERGVPVHTSYGLTEMASQVTATPPGAADDALRTAGRPLRYREVMVDERGEILVRGRTLFAGYIEAGRLVRPLEGGWFRTGDLGEMDEGGSLRVLGRRDNMFISGGENIQPETIERALLRLPGISQAVVVPIGDPEFGRRPVAFVQAESLPDPGLCRDALRVYLPGYMIPVSIHPLPSASSQGLKPSRSELRMLAGKLASSR